MGAHVDRHVVDSDREIGAVVEIVAAQEILVGFALAGVLGHDQPGHGFQHFARPRHRPRVELLAGDVIWLAMLGGAGGPEPGIRRARTRSSAAAAPDWLQRRAAPSVAACATRASTADAALARVRATAPSPVAAAVLGIWIGRGRRRRARRTQYHQTQFAPPRRHRDPRTRTSLTRSGAFRLANWSIASMTSLSNAGARYVRKSMMSIEFVILTANMPPERRECNA